MKISLTNVGKRFNRDWVFRHVNLTFESPGCYAITGPNGSGKSTFLQLLAGAMDQSEGKIFWTGDKQYEDQEIFRQVSIAAPYLELIEEMTALEFLHFHKQFKPLIKNISLDEILTHASLSSAAHKQMRFYSSGMKQRMKLVQAIFSDTPILLLDEPCTNLDEPGYQLYYSLLEKYTEGRIVIISSNDEREFSFCREKINILDFKNGKNQV